MAGRTATHHLILQQGETFEETWTYGIRDEETGVITPYDLTGATVVATFKRRASDPDPPLLEIEIDHGGVTGEMPFVLTDEQTETDLRGRWDLQIHWADGSERMPMKGSVVWTPAVGD